MRTQTSGYLIESLGTCRCKNREEEIGDNEKVKAFTWRFEETLAGKKDQHFGHKRRI